MTQAEELEMTIFYGRHEELERMLSTQRMPGAKLFVVMGRRRICTKSTKLAQTEEDRINTQFAEWVKLEFHAMPEWRNW